MPGRPTLSLCMIVKNEAPRLKRCLESARGLVDEVIVVDTGSHDGTPELAQQLGALVYHDPWQENFSRARNVSLSRATGDWALILDADEELAGGKELIPSLLEAEDQVEGYLFQVESPTTDLPGAQVLRHLNLRLFRRRPEYAFVGAIHEQILPSILSARPQARILEAEVVVRHHGYLQAQNAAKAARNRVILEAALACTPNDVFLRYHLGITRYQERDVKGALELFWPLYHRLPRETNFYPTLVRHLAIALLDAGDAQQALSVLEKECQRFPDYPELFYLRALALRCLRRYREAIQILEHCCQMADPPRRYVSTVGINGPLALAMLGQIYGELGQGRKAAQCFLKALELLPEHGGAWSGLISELRGRGLGGTKLAEAVRQLTSPGVHSGQKSLVQALLDAGEGQAALMFLPAPEDPAWEEGGVQDWHLLKSRGLMQIGHWKEALRMALKAWLPSPSHSEALKLAILAASLGERWRLMNSLLRRLASLATEAVADVWQAYSYCLGGEADSVPPQLKPGDVEQRGEAWNLLGRLLETHSRRHVDLALRIVTALEGGADYLRLGHLYYRHGWVAEAADFYLKALEAKVADEMMCLAMGRICTAKGLHREAAIFYQQAAELNPTPRNSLLLVEARLREAAAWLADGERQFPESLRLAALKEAIDVSLERLSRGDS